MSLHEYKISQQIEATDPPFYALIMAAMRKADTRNVALLRLAFPKVWEELNARYHAPGGKIGAEVLRTPDPHTCVLCYGEISNDSAVVIVGPDDNAGLDAHRACAVAARVRFEAYD